MGSSPRRNGDTDELVLSRSRQDHPLNGTYSTKQTTVNRKYAQRTNTSQAVPEITNEFNSFDDFGWYGSAYLISCCALQLLFGKLFTFFSVKYTLFLSVLTFEVASAVCGAAPSSITFIIGRAIAGIGAAGIFAGAVGSIRLLPSGRCRSYWTRRCPTKNFERNQIRQIPYTEPSLGGLEVSYAHHRM